jgi:hypothetical protein
VPDGRLRIVSHFPGRLRVRAARFRDTELAHAVATKLREEEGVHGAEATPFTGSMLVEYDARRIQLPWLVQLVVKLGGLDGLEVDHDGRPIRAQGPAVRNALDRVNNALLDATRGRIDTKTAVPATLAGLGIYALFFGRRRLPEWYDLLFWSFTAFVNLNPPTSAQPIEADGETS